MTSVHVVSLKLPNVAMMVQLRMAKVFKMHCLEFEVK